MLLDYLPLYLLRLSFERRRKRRGAPMMPMAIYLSLPKCYANFASCSWLIACWRDSSMPSAATALRGADNARPLLSLAVTLAWRFNDAPICNCFGSRLITDRAFSRR